MLELAGSEGTGRPLEAFQLRTESSEEERKHRHGEPECQRQANQGRLAYGTLLSQRQCGGVRDLLIPTFDFAAHGLRENLVRLGARLHFLERRLRARRAPGLVHRVDDVFTAAGEELAYHLPLALNGLHQRALMDAQLRVAVQLGKRGREVGTGCTQFSGALRILNAHILVRLALQTACRGLKSREHPHAIVTHLGLFHDPPGLPSGLQDENRHEPGQHETGRRGRRKLGAQTPERCCEHAAIRARPTFRRRAGNACVIPVHRAFTVRSFRRQR